MTMLAMDKRLLDRVQGFLDGVEIQFNAGPLTLAQDFRAALEQAERAQQSGQGQPLPDRAEK